MPRYYFSIYDGVSLPDKEGTELPDTRAARREALILAGAVIQEEAKRDALGEEWRLELTDETGLLLVRLDVTITESPALNPMQRSAPIVQPAPETILGK